jgi:AcrR family transcriptional regulator
MSSPRSQKGRPPGKTGARGAPPASRRRNAPPSREAYHHGALRAALIEATEALLAERGAEGFSLREVARRSGVSPAAPAHHFGDAEGLLTAVATHAFDGLTAALREGNERGGGDPLARLREQGLGYVGFALRHPGRFALMFRTGPGGVRRDDALARSAQAAFAVLEEGMRQLLGVPAAAPLSAAAWQALLATWSVVHGFAHLALAGQFDAPPAPGRGDETAPCEPPLAAAAGGRRGREALLNDLLTPLLEQHLRGVLHEHAAPRAASTSSSR